MVIEFFIPCIPPKATGSQKRIITVRGRPIVTKTKDAKDAESTLDGLLMAHQPHSPVVGPLSVTVSLTWPWRKGEPKKRLLLGSVPHTSKPDVDNYLKSLFDCLTRLRFWNDDAEIAELFVRKSWGDRPGIGIAIRSLGGDNVEKVSVPSPQDSLLLKRLSNGLLEVRS